jgi:hypothetical protein
MPNEPTPDDVVPAAPSTRATILLAGALLLVAGGTFGWAAHRWWGAAAAESDDQEGKADPRSMHVRVVTAAVERGGFAATAAFVGVVAPDPKAVLTLSGRAGGLVTATSAVPGQLLQRGDAILAFDGAPLQAACLQARSTFANAKYVRSEFERVGRARMETDLVAAEDRSAKEARLASEQLTRLGPLHDSGGIADRAYAEAGLTADRTRLEHEQAARALAAWRDHGAELQLANLVAAEVASEAALQQAELACTDASVKAPAAGRLLALAPRVGDRCEPGAALGVLLVAKDRVLSFPVTPALAAHLAPGAAVTFADPEDREVHAAVRYVAGQVGKDGMVEVTAAIEPTEPPLLPGALARGEVEIQQLADVAIVPATAVLRNGDQSHVFVRLAEGAGRRVPVKVLGRRGDRVAVDGEFPAGARAVIAGGYNVPDGAQLVEAPAEASATAKPPADEGK